ncbi:glycosyltransferase family 9 protein [Acidisphaera sp. S103]|uniref:glycosyltransferase family 9 protein n=1 Tax=Acidisphaera sp. S103 TaxID=1747223 RepID=UPI00131B55A5|nr:glycosyltransferase family 9 protein [Acidisphaera sp. S103]
MTHKIPASQKKPTGTRKRAVKRPNDNIVAVAAGAVVAVAPDDPPNMVVADPVILIEIDPAVSGGYAHGRFDIAIRGRAVSEAAIEEIRLQVGDWITSSASFGQPERAAIVAMPDGTPGRLRGFRFNLPRPGDGEAERCQFKIVARTEDGFEYAEDFEIDIDPTTGEPISVVSGPVRTIGARPYAIMYIERGTIDGDGVLSVEGWAMSLGPTLAVQIFVDEERIGKAKIGGEREDVGAAFPGYPNGELSGFSLTLQLDEVDRDARRIRAQIVCPNGFGHEESIPVERLRRRGVPRPQRAGEPAPTASPSPTFSLFNQQPTYQLSADFQLQDNALFALVLPDAPPVAAAAASSRRRVATAAPALPEPPAEIRMHCDTALLTGDGTLTLEGWAVCGIGIVQVRVLLNDDEVGLASMGYPRPDVGALFAEIPMARLSGFRFDQRIGERFEGEHTVRVIVRSSRDDEEEARIPVVVTAVAVPEQVPVADISSSNDDFELTPDQAKEFRFEMDSPVVANGVAVALITGRLTIDGWLLSRTGIASFEVFLDDQRLGDAHYGLARQDVGAAFPEWPNALRSGFAFHCPPRSLRDGDHTIELRIRANSGQDLTRAFGFTVRKSDDQKDSVAIRRRLPRVEMEMISGFLADMAYRPAFRFVLRQDGAVEIDRLRVTLDALVSQAYADWTVLVLAGDDEIGAATRTAIDDWVPHLASRFAVISPADADAWSALLAQADADDGPVLYGLLLPGDEPGADALLELAMASGRHPDRDLLYGDEVRPSPVSKDSEPFFKPDFSLDLLLSTNYIGRVWVASAALLARAGVTPASLVSGGEYDLVLRCAELAGGIHHIPKLLCQRSVVELDGPALERAALERALERRGIAGEVLATPIQGTWRVKRAVPTTGKVSIIIPTCASHGYIETCIETLRSRTAYRDFEIICIDNIPQSEVAWKVWLQQHADKVIEIQEAFNWSVFNNRAAAMADGEFLLFLNDDIEIIQDDWLDAMLEHARRPEVGITGPQLLYRDGKVQHAGMFLANNGIGRHAFRFAANDDPGYFGLALTQRNVIAVTGACMLVRRETFEQLGRFDEAHEIVNNDLDFCLRAHREGLLTVYTPYASLTHYELASRANLKDVFDLSHFNAAWKTTFAEGDPYFNPRLSRHADDYRPDDEPVQTVVSGGPLFLAEEIQRILVVKLDHIGDFVTALPPIRRLKTLFPHARITVLAGPASRAFVPTEPCIDEFIPFAFFHARSQLGERDLTANDYAELAGMLRPYRFDLAIDLRKHLSTRDVLKHTGARFLAGFDYLGQCPYLDIALDWDGDRTLQRKRSHIVDDLIGLVDAVGHAAETDRILMQPGPAAMPLAELPDPVRALFAKPVVAIHPGAGNITKQWPEEHFSALIDLLVEKNGVNILLVGGADEVDVASKLLESVQHPKAIASMTGKTTLVDLPRLLKNCVLYIGNDSGPKHIAAAVGIPTVGIHSGVVDPVEWGPVGLNAVALRRNMTCSPCYLAKAEDCPRALACLRLFEPNLVYETADLLLKRSELVNAAVVDLAEEPKAARELEAEREQPATEPA